MNDYFRNASCIPEVIITGDMKKFFRIITNKYILTGIAFLTWCMFFDQNDWLSMRDKQQELDGLKSDNAYLQKQISGMENERTTLINDNQKIEQFARENYHMKRDNEDVYVVDNGK